MADNLKFDFSDVLKLAADLGQVPDNAGPNIRKAVEVTARNVKETWRDLLKGSTRIPRGPSSISYDISGVSAVSGSSVTAEIGPTVGAGGVGGLVGMLEYGTPSTAPTGFGAGALQKNEGDFQKGLEIALQQAERKAGL